MKEEGKNWQSKGSFPKVGIVPQGRDGTPSGPKSQARSAVSGTGAAPAYALRDSGLASRREKWDACGEASLPIHFEGRCRAAGTFGVYRPFFFPSRHTLFRSSVFSVSSVVNPSQNKLDDCLSQFENTHLFSPMNLHLQPQDAFFSSPLQTSGIFVQHLRSRF